MLLRFIFTNARVLIGAIVAAFFAFAATASAQSTIEKLVSPGQLSKDHQGEDITCNSCHASFKKTAQNALCLECHKDVAADIAALKGFHGKSTEVSGALCKLCHTEHEGAEFDIAAFDKPAFDHRLTDYPLLGAHKKAECAACHVAGKKFREAPSRCNDCHAKDDAHKGTLGSDCASCHKETLWKDVTFNHDKTKFPLLGGHKIADCAACHIAKKFKGTPTDCFACHKKDDAHKGAYGTACANCHDEKSWKSPIFDHATKTGFALRGAHRTIVCSACHTVSLTEPKLGRTCIACHRKVDVHKGRNGADCTDCHNEETWKTNSFNHDTQTKFPLKGGHKTVECALCHIEPVTKALPGRACIDCHQKDDPHKGSLGANCAACHNQTSWTQSVKFDHDLSSFPLLGAHKNAKCEACHTTKDFKTAPSDCKSCHADDDAHKGALGSDCGECHNPGGWSHWRFDHDAQTKFPLTGGHQGLKCAACHRSEAKEKIQQSSDCIACHRSDDKHRGQYGTNCERCHSPDAWDQIKFP
ncbi:MAG: cytochrome c3 family protein [Parvularculaceae bacterium]